MKYAYWSSAFFCLYLLQPPSGSRWSEWVGAVLEALSAPIMLWATAGALLLIVSGLCARRVER